MTECLTLRHGIWIPTSEFISVIRIASIPMLEWIYAELLGTILMLRLMSAAFFLLTLKVKLKVSEVGYDVCKLL